MKIWKICSALLALAIVSFAFAPSSSAQAIPIVAVGSSALFPSAAISATKGDPVRGVATPLCGSRFWTGSASAIDARKSLTSPNIPDEGGNLWVAWDNDASPTIICAYLSVDTIVGQRLFFGQGASGNATLSIPTAACTTAGGNKIAFVWDTATSGLPLAVHNALMGNSGASCAAPTNPVHFNVAFTDVRPEDAQFIGNNRVLCNDANATAFFPPDDKSCMGFGPGVSSPGTAVVSSFSGSSAQAVAYSFTGSDPISGIAIPASTTAGVGAESIIIIANTLDNTSAGFGTLMSTGVLNNVTSHTLSALYTRQAFFTRDLVGGTPGALAQNFVRLLQREPMSGTYTTFEWQVIRQRDGFNANSQETGILGPSQPGYSSACFVQNADAFPTVTCSNPLSFCIGGNCGLRTRVIGTGQMVSTANNASFAPAQSILGYAFWSLGSFGGKANIKYLKLDGEDPLFTGYSVHNGAFPGVVAGQGTVAITPPPAAGQCGGYFNGDGGATIADFSCNAYTLPTFDSIQAGNYRAWNIIRAAYFGSAQSPSFAPLNIAGFIAGAQDQAAPANPPSTKIPDFLPTQICANAACSSFTQILNSFRSHYSIGGVVGNNGIQSGSTEAGGDVAGAVFNSQSELDNGLLGGTFLSWVQ